MRGESNTDGLYPSNELEEISPVFILKSSSANLRALRLSDLCKDLELLGRLGDLGGAMELMEKTEEKFGRVRKALGLEISGQLAKPS